ncbi:hypothetical protein CISG_10133 [Coccidioides immitis RMSCC 3703]|uniref:Amine oxidase domain-containing protein n=1 Tax=Coccidioides immitis RMSCC 3703 TaxID=454286 RepID=A0A0J8QMJ0_COCIT|nr:hypothetical protein CISG_10133 [Coccidioides immitis RMSCC 3703]
MRAFDRGFYPNLTAMYDYLGIRYHQELFFFTFARLPKHGSKALGSPMEQPNPYFIHSSNNHRIPPVRPQACGFWTWVRRPFTLHSAWYGSQYAVHSSHPRNQGLRLAARPNLFNCRVTSVTRQQHGSGVRVTWDSPGNTQQPDTVPHQKIFDHVILAVPPNAVGSIFAPLRSEMSHIPTAAVESIVHTDLSATKQQPSNALYEMHLAPTPPNWIHFRSSPYITETIHEDSISSVVVTNFPTTPDDPSEIIARRIHCT